MLKDTFKNYPNQPLKEPVHDWRDMPSLNEVVLRFYGLYDKRVDKYDNDDKMRNV